MKMKMKIHRKRKVQNSNQKTISVLDGHLPSQTATDIASTICEN